MNIYFISVLNEISKIECDHNCGYNYIVIRS